MRICVSVYFLKKSQPDCDALMKGKERLLEQDKQGLGGSKLYFNALSLDF
jgi:hypothetical protein